MASVHTRVGTTSRLSLNRPGAGLGIAEKVDRGKELRSRNCTALPSTSRRRALVRKGLVSNKEVLEEVKVVRRELEGKRAR